MNKNVNEFAITIKIHLTPDQEVKVDDVEVSPVNRKDINGEYGDIIASGIIKPVGGPEPRFIEPLKPEDYMD
ncbi:MAG: hypothetical protein Q4B34_00195 [Candidatus Saccharibacteria bacterium]|nr:hypothetical protein [Candidatus Saccharibacteria bacterium]